jgi:PKD repeat protein
MISFIPQITGNYYLLIEPIQGSFEISKTNVPLSLYKNKNDPIHIISTPCSIYFWIGDVDSFCINISGQGTFEGAQTTIFHSSVTGYEMVISGGTTQYHNALTFNVNVPSDARNRIWKIDISQPSAPQWLEDVYITFNQDVDPYFGLTDNSLYFMKQKIVSIPNDNGGSSSGVDTSFNPGENEAEDNTLPSTPRQPSGPTFVERGVEYLYTSSTSSVNGVKIRYRFEWGDDAISNWSVFVSSNTSISMSHSWEIISSFEMRVIAQDENGFNSSWSIPLIVTVSQINLSEEPPIVDFILPSNVSTNKIIQFDTVGSFDSDGAIITYFWDFGDGEIGTGKKPYHIYKNPGQYTVTLTITNNMGNIYSKSSIITVAASDEGIAQDQQNFALPYLHFIIMGTIIIVLTCLILFFRSRIKRFFLEKGISHGVRKIERLDAEITELKHAIQKNH